MATPAPDLALFVTTWMEPEAERLIVESLNKNYVDQDEYPRTTVIQERCVNMLARLYHAPHDAEAVGTGTVGSSEAIMLAGLAAKWRGCRPPGGGREAELSAESRHGLHRAGRLGEVCPLLRRRACATCP